MYIMLWRFVRNINYIIIITYMYLTYISYNHPEKKMDATIFFSDLYDCKCYFIYVWEREPSVNFFGSCFNECRWNCFQKLTKNHLYLHVSHGQPKP